MIFTFDSSSSLRRFLEAFPDVVIGISCNENNVDKNQFSIAYQYDTEKRIHEFFLLVHAK